MHIDAKNMCITLACVNVLKRLIKCDLCKCGIYRVTKRIISHSPLSTWEKTFGFLSHMNINVFNGTLSII